MKAVPLIASLAFSWCGALRSAEVIYRVPLGEAGQSGICLRGDRLFLTIHSRLEGPLQGGFFNSGDILGGGCCTYIRASTAVPARPCRRR